MPRTLTHPALGPIKARFPGAGLKAAEFRDMTTLVVPREVLVEVCAFLRDDPALRYDMCAEINGVDYLNFPGATDRFAVNYCLLSIPNNSRLWLKVFLNPTADTSPGHALRDENVLERGDDGLKVSSVTGLWLGAEWMEREVYDMLGIIFTGHPDLRRILTWNGYPSYPLRKDYPLRGLGERENYKIVTRESA